MSDESLRPNKIHFVFPGGIAEVGGRDIPRTPSGGSRARGVRGPREVLSCRSAADGHRQGEHTVFRNFLPETRFLRDRRTYI